MSSLWAVVVTITWLCLPARCALVPEFLDSDLPSLLAHFKIQHLTSVHNARISFGAAHELASVKGAAGKLRVFVDSVRCTEVSLSRPRGAVFYPATQDKQPCAADVTRKLIEDSTPQRPLFLYSPTETSAPPWLHDVYIPFNTSVYLILRHPLEPDTLTLQEVYHLDEQRAQLVVNVLGQRKLFSFKVTEDKSLDEQIRWRWQLQGSQVTRRDNLMGTEVKVIYPEVALQKITPLQNIFDVFNNSLQTVLLHINASIKPSYTSDWGEMVPSLRARQAELAFLPAVLKDNQSLIDFSSPYETKSSRLYIRKPAYTYSLSTVLRTFTLRTWAASCALQIALTVTLFVVTYVYKEFVGDSQRPFTFSDGLLVTIGNACIQGWERLPGSVSGRILCIASSWAGLLLNAFFVSQLQAGLLSSAPTLPFRDFGELLRTDYRVFVDKRSTAYSLIQKQTKADLIKQMRSVLIVNSSKHEVGVCEKRVALLMNTVTAASVTQSFNCSIVDTQVDEFTRWVSLPMVKNFRFKRLINYSVRRMVEGGLVQRKKAALRRLTQAAAQNDPESFKQIEMSIVIPFFRIFYCLLVIVFAIFVLELTWYNVEKRIGSRNRAGVKPRQIKRLSRVTHYRGGKVPPVFSLKKADGLAPVTF